MRPRCASGSRDDPTHLGKVIVTEFHAPQLTEVCLPGTADVVLTFRNVHNWLETGNQQAQFNAFFKALKPGGVLGVVEHRARPGTTLEEMRKSGYMDEDYIKKLAATAGFRAAYPVTGTESAAWAMFVVVSRKKAALSAAACWAEGWAQPRLGKTGTRGFCHDADGAAPVRRAHQSVGVKCPAVHRRDHPCPSTSGKKS